MRTRKNYSRMQRKWITSPMGRVSGGKCEKSCAGCTQATPILIAYCLIGRGRQKIFPADANPVSAIRRATRSRKNRNVLKEVFEADKMVEGYGQKSAPLKQEPFLCSVWLELVPKTALCQGMTSVVPKRSPKTMGFSPCGIQIEFYHSIFESVASSSVPAH